MFLGSLIALPLGGAMVWAWWTGWTFGGQRLNLAGGGLGALACFAGAMSMPRGIRNLSKRRELIFGSDRLQIVEDGEKVELQVPYKNILHAGLGEDRHGSYTSRYIGVKLVDQDDPDTLNARGRGTAAGWDCRLIGNSWAETLEQICERLHAKLGVRATHDPAEHVRWER
jgi:hypothetical protein